MLNPLRDDGLLSLGAETAGIVDLHDCLNLGITDDKIRWLVRSGRWQRVYPRVFATFSGRLDANALSYAALLYAGPESALSHESAGAAHGLCARPVAVHVLVPYAHDVASRSGLVVHRSRTFRPADVEWTRPAITTLERTVLDLLGGRRSADAALGLVSDALRTGRTSVDRLREALVAAPTTKWRRAVLEALPDLAAGAQSPLEVRDARLRRAHGLPQGTRQYRRSGAGVEFLDVLIEEWKVHIELDGRLGHDRAQERWRDMRRDNRSERDGLRHLRYGWADVFDRPCEVAIEQAVILRQQGWTGQFVRCRDCPGTLPPGL
ncbi:MAG TPA: hypothetical protein VHB69_05390 [Mycobacteriales bacterium]|nr:hypothetical protein [Mycobacteriales bacterium]